MIWLVFQMLFFAIFTFDRLYASELATKRNFSTSIVYTAGPVVNAKCLSKNTLRSAIRRKLREIFSSQYPESKFCLRGYSIENWPLGINSHDSCKWNKADLLLINEVIPYIRFIPRNTAIKAEYRLKNIRHSLREIECLTSATLKMDYNKAAMMAMLFERFKLETGQPSASKIDWKMLNRSQIPKKYENVLLNSATVSNKLVYKNPEIIDNIHFYLYPNINVDIDKDSDAKENENESYNCESMRIYKEPENIINFPFYEAEEYEKRQRKRKFESYFMQSEYDILHDPLLPLEETETANLELKLISDQSSTEN